MKRMMLLAACCVLLAGVAVRDEEKAKSPATKPTTQPMNAMCPIDKDHAIDDRETILFDGKLIGFCCEDCKVVFNKDPKKYVEGMK